MEKISNILPASARVTTVNRTAISTIDLQPEPSEPTSFFRGDESAEMAEEAPASLQLTPRGSLINVQA